MKSKIAAFTSEAWNRLDPDTRENWPALYVPANSPLSNPNARSNTSENTRALGLWSYLRDTLSRGDDKAMRLLTEIREADRRASDDPVEHRRIFQQMHADAENALRATDLELKMTDAFASGDLDAAEIPSWMKTQITQGKEQDLHGMIAADPRNGSLLPGSLVSTSRRNYAVVMTSSYATEAEARVLASTLEWARQQDPIAKLDPEKVKADFAGMRPVPKYDRVGPAVGIVTSRFYPNQQAVADFIRHLDPTMPVIVTGKFGDKQNQLLEAMTNAAALSGRRVINAQVTASADKTKPHDVAAITESGHSLWLKPSDFPGTIVVLNYAEAGKGMGAAQILLHQKLVDMASAVVTFDDGRGDWGVRQANCFALETDKLRASFDHEGKQVDLAAVSERDRHYLKGPQDYARDALPKDWHLESPIGVLMLASIPGMGRNEIRALQERYKTVGDMLSEDSRALPVDPAMRERLADPRVIARAAAEAQNQMKTAQESGIQILPFSDAKFPLRVSASMPNPPAVLYVKGTLPSLNTSFAIVGTTEGGPKPNLDPDVIMKKLNTAPPPVELPSGKMHQPDPLPVRLPNGIRLEPKMAGMVSVALPEMMPPVSTQKLEQLGASVVKTGTTRAYMFTQERLKEILPELLPAKVDGPGISEEGKMRTAMLGAGASKSGTVVVPLLPGASEFALHGAAAARGDLLAIAPCALNQIKSADMRTAADAAVNAGGAVISFTPLNRDTIDVSKAIKASAQIAGSVILAEAQSNSVSLIAVAEAYGKKPTMALVPDEKHAGTKMGGNWALLAGPGKTTIEMPTTTTGVNTTMYDGIKDQTLASDGGRVTQSFQWNNPVTPIRHHDFAVLRDLTNGTIKPSQISSWQAPDRKQEVQKKERTAFQREALADAAQLGRSVWVANG